MKIIYSPRFAKLYKKLPKRIKLLAEGREEVFRQNPFASILKTHKLKGELKDFYSFSISYNWRIVFHFEDKDTVVFDNVGTHMIYK